MEHGTFKLAGRHVLVTLEKQFWDCLEDIAVERDLSLRKLVGQVGKQHPLDIRRLFARMCSRMCCGTPALC